LPVTRQLAPTWPWRLFEAPESPGWTKPAASLGIRQYALPSTSSSAVALVGRVLPPVPVFQDHWKTRFVLVVSHHFDALHRERLAGVLQPAADRRVRRVSRCRRAVHLPKQSRSCDAILATRFVPFEESPSSVAVLRHRSRCLLVVRCAHPKPPKRDQGHRRPGWAPIRRSESPHTRPSHRRSGRQDVKRSRPFQLRHRSQPNRGASASRLSSTDESVSSCRRCQQNDDLSFHGLCSPSRYLRAYSTPVEYVPSTSRTQAPR
jgi:hypothetical protein